jgi:imidazole glycerol-phosphate synthase subunit HisF
MANVRLIARLDIKGPNLIKGIHLEGLRMIGDPQSTPDATTSKAQTS